MSRRRKLPIVRLDTLPYEEWNERNTAYHESAHCVLAILVGWRFASATVIPDDDCGGQVLLAPDAPALDLFRRAIVFVGGSIGVDLANGAARWIPRAVGVAGLLESHRDWHQTRVDLFAASLVPPEPERAVVPSDLSAAAGN